MSNISAFIYSFYSFIWLNHEDPLINHNPWTILEDKKQRGLYNWIDIAITFGTHRTPFQCLARYQRSLNPHILNKDWTEEEDAMLRAAVENFGDSNWQMVSSSLEGRTGPQCSNRWLNHEDPLIYHNPWTILEDKKLLFIVQERGLYNWIDIAITLGTHRTPFQCLARYQRSLNPHIFKKDWTEEEDAKLRAAVENFGDNNWQMVSSSLEGRTGPQCSNRWRKSILPDRRVGRWSIDEDKRLKVAVMLFGAKNWNKIARFAPGRTQVQCRERWLNCLDPSLNLEAWTAEEDAKLLDAINMYGYCWSKVATCVPPRTDSQCRRRWKVLLPHEVPLLQAARQIKRTALVSNFVDRESERPSIGPNDFCPSANPPVAEKEKSGRTRMKRPRERTKSKKQLEANRNNLSKKRRPKSREPDQNVIADDTINSSEDNALAILPLIPLSKALNTGEMRDIKRPRNKASRHHRSDGSIYSNQ